MFFLKELLPPPPPYHYGGGCFALTQNLGARWFPSNGNISSCLVHQAAGPSPVRTHPPCTRGEIPPDRSRSCPAVPMPPRLQSAAGVLQLSASFFRSLSDSWYRGLPSRPQ